MPRYLELTIKAPESVYMPAEDSYLAAELLDKVLEGQIRGQLSVLDMGTGSGILGLTAAASPKVVKVVLADINPLALDAARKNLELNQSLMHSKCSFIKTDLFSNIPRDLKFDMILFNAPYLPGGKEGSSVKLTWDGGITGVELTIKFLKEAVNRLEDGGVILIVHSSLADEQKLWAKMKVLKLNEIMTMKCHVFFEDIFATLLKKQ